MRNIMKYTHTMGLISMKYSGIQFPHKLKKRTRNFNIYFSLKNTLCEVGKFKPI
jgi:hypothetical protein